MTKTVNRDTVIVELPQPMARSHQYRLGDLVACRRTPGLLGETWQSIEARPTVPDVASLPPADEVKVAEKPAKRKLA